MGEIIVEVIGDTSNPVVIKLPQRAMPSFCLQGDSLVTMASIANKNAILWLENSGSGLFPDDHLDDVVYMSNKLVSMAMAYNNLIAQIASPTHRLLNIGHLKLLEIE